MSPTSYEYDAMLFPAFVHRQQMFSQIKVSRLHLSEVRCKFFWAIFIAVSPILCSHVDSIIVHLCGTPRFIATCERLCACVVSHSSKVEWKDALLAWAGTCHSQAFPLNKNM